MGSVVIFGFWTASKVSVKFGPAEKENRLVKYAAKWWKSNVLYMGLEMCYSILATS